MRRNHIHPYNQLDPRDGVLVVDGFGIAIRVDRGHLLVEDGAGRIRRSRRFPKAGHGLERVVLLGSSGYISLEAVSWLDRLNIPLVHVTADGHPVISSTRLGLRNARLRRAQATAAGTQLGLEISRFLLGHKLAGQAAVARTLGKSDHVEEAAAKINEARSMEALLRLEAHTAAEYWALWKDLPVRFVVRDTKTVPDLWLRFGTRSSPVSGKGPRLAANPGNAIMNYLYALLETEAVVASHAVGLDPQLGFFHADTVARDSLAADLMEAVRPEVDRYVLHLLAETTFPKRDFIETPEGVCRLSTNVTHRLAETTTRWAAALGPIVEHVASVLLDETVPTPITQNRRRRAHGGNIKAARPSTRLDDVCPDCGGEPTPTGVYCPSCVGRRAADWLPRLSERATQYLARARAEGQDPAHGGEAGRKRARSHRQRQAEVREWDAQNERPDPDVFRTQIWPSLKSTPLRRMQEATGLSGPYCSMIRRGAYVPHPRHWDALRRVGSQS